MKKIITLLIIAGVAFASLKAYQLYQGVKEPNVNIDGKKSAYIFIPTNANYKDVTNILYANNIIINRSSFEWVAEKKNYANHVKPGRYKIKANMSNNALVNLLRSGKQEPIMLVFNKVRVKERFAGIIANQIELDSANFVKKLYNSSYLKKYGKSVETALTLFIPNTYEFYWNTTVDEFMERMNVEYKHFWNSSRLKKAKKLI